MYVVQLVFYYRFITVYSVGMEDLVSKQNIFGRFVNYDEDEEIFVSVKTEILEIVHRSINEVPQKVHVIKCELSDFTTEIKTSYNVEGSSILKEDVYKKITLRGGLGENRIEIMEYKLCSDPRKEHLKLDHQEFLYGLVTYFFVEIEGKQCIKVRFVKQIILSNIFML